MFKDDVKRTIGTILKESKHKMLPVSKHSIYFVKRYSDKLAFYINCFDNRAYDGPITVTLYFTGVTMPDDSILNFDLGISIPILKMYQVQQSDEAFKQFSEEDCEIADRLMLAAGRKIVDIESGMDEKMANMILNEIQNPYISSKRTELYREKVKIYDVLNGDKELRDEFELFKRAYQKVYKKPAAFKLCNEFIDKLPKTYFEEKGITGEVCPEDKLSYIKKALAWYLYCQCVLGLEK